MTKFKKWFAQALKSLIGWLSPIIKAKLEIWIKELENIIKQKEADKILLKLKKTNKKEK